MCALLPAVPLRIRRWCFYFQPGLKGTVSATSPTTLQLMQPKVDKPESLTLCEAIDRFRLIAHSNLIFGSYGYRGSPFFACMQLRDKRCCWRFEKTFVLQKNLSFWPSEVALPFLPAPYSGVARSSCLRVWFAELRVNGLPALDSSCDVDDSVVWTSIFRSERTVPCWGSLEACQRPGELEMQRRKQHTSRFWRYVRILPDDFCLRQLFWQTFQCATNFWICFSWSVRQKLSDKVRL